MDENAKIIRGDNFSNPASHLPLLLPPRPSPQVELVQCLPPHKLDNLHNVWVLFIVNTSAALSSLIYL
ncbi:hypothetical protein ACLOJK_029342 [Asimina triloba]